MTKMTRKEKENASFEFEIMRGVIIRESMRDMVRRLLIKRGEDKRAADGNAVNTLTELCLKNEKMLNYITGELKKNKSI